RPRVVSMGQELATLQLRAQYGRRLDAWTAVQETRHEKVHLYEVANGPRSAPLPTRMLVARVAWCNHAGARASIWFVDRAHLGTSGPALCTQSLTSHIESVAALHGCALRTITRAPGLHAPAPR